MFKCAMLGCGPRAKGHAKAYEHVKRGELAAICDLQSDRLNAFGDEFGVSTRYTDAERMLAEIQPDVLHVVTIPALRVELLTFAAEHNVPAVIVEKPIALDGADYKAICELERTTSTKICVNTQLHFHANNLMLKKDVAAGRIGDIRFIDASARSTPLDQGVHVLELAHSYNGFDPLTCVFGNVAGQADLDSRQPAPNSCAANVSFANGVRASLACGMFAPTATEHEVRYFHKRCAVYGTRGWTQWTMGGWERFTEDEGYQSGIHDYRDEDVLAQARLTEAMFDWLEDEAKPHPTRLARSLEEFGCILGIYASALRHEPIDLPFDPPDDLLSGLRERLTS